VAIQAVLISSVILVGGNKRWFESGRGAEKGTQEEPIYFFRTAISGRLTGPAILAKMPLLTTSVF
jgi:hypothetical protein